MFTATIELEMGDVYTFGNLSIDEVEEVLGRFVGDEVVNITVNRV